MIQIRIPLVIPNRALRVREKNIFVGQKLSKFKNFSNSIEGDKEGDFDDGDDG